MNQLAKYIGYNDIAFCVSCLEPLLFRGYEWFYRKDIGRFLMHELYACKKGCVQIATNAGRIGPSDSDIDTWDIDNNRICLKCKVPFETIAKGTIFISEKGVIDEYEEDYYIGGLGKEKIFTGDLNKCPVCGVEYLENLCPFARKHYSYVELRTEPIVNQLAYVKLKALE